jgi:hypothetical protein
MRNSKLIEAVTLSSEQLKRDEGRMRDLQEENDSLRSKLLELNRENQLWKRQHGNLHT